MQRSRYKAIMAAVMLASPFGVHAADISGSVDIVSDYRFRGISLSGHDPALQATLHAAQGPVFVEGFLTTLGHGSNGATVETDLSVGGSRKIGKDRITLSATWYLYPGSHQHGVAELIGRYDHPIGPATVSLTAGYAPSQHALGGDDNLYLGLSATVPIGRAALFAGIGRERGGQAPGGKIDWQLGAQTTVHGFDASVSYIDCDRSIRDGHLRRVSNGTAVFQLGYSF